MTSRSDHSRRLPRESTGTWGEDQTAQKTLPLGRGKEGVLATQGPQPLERAMPLTLTGFHLGTPSTAAARRQGASISPIEGIPEENMEDRSTGCQNLSARGLSGQLFQSPPHVKEQVCL